MEKQIFEGKSLEDAIKNACITLNASENEIITVLKEEKKGLFSKKVEIEAITIQDLNKAIKDYIMFIIKGMGLNANIEIRNKEEVLVFNIISSDPILIGRNGRTIDAIQTLATQMVSSNLNFYYRFLIDVNDYKDRKRIRLEKLAKYTARDVARMKIEIKLDPMNSYERRIIHNILTNSKDVYTESVGEEPNRYIVVKAKE